MRQVRDRHPSVPEERASDRKPPCARSHLHPRTYRMSHLLVVFLLLLLGWFWLDSLRAREIATEICKAACSQRELQFLDQTVALRRLGLAWKSEGMRIRRVYRFDFSEEGVGRRNGYLVMRGLVLEDLSFGLPTETQDA
jgi:hypothetical protein